VLLLMILALHGVAHWLRRGHFAEFVRLGPALICRVCDVGTPRGRTIPIQTRMTPVGTFG
jgi:hypothetical protein